MMLEKLVKHIQKIKGWAVSSIQTPTQNVSMT
jgi:hypothetical protein